MPITYNSTNEFGNKLVGQVNDFYIVFNEKKKEYYVVMERWINGPLKNAVAWKKYKDAYRAAQVKDLRVQGYSWSKIAEWEKEQDSRERKDGSCS